MSTSKILIDGVGIDLTQDTVAANKMLSGTKAHDANGDVVTGNIPSKVAATYTPGTSAQTIGAGQYLGGAQTIQGDANLVAENIASGKTIFGVPGTHAGQKPEQSKTVTPTAGGQTVTPDSGKVLSSVVINGDADLVAGNVKSGVNIFGVTGTLQPAKTEQSKTLTLGASAPSTVTPDSGKVLSSVPVVLDTSVIKAENIAKDVQILGVTGTHEGGGGGGETWVINLNPESVAAKTYYVNFLCNSQEYCVFYPHYSKFASYISCYRIIDRLGSSSWPAEHDFISDMLTIWRPDSGWVDEAYRTITFQSPVTGDLLTWLEANAVKQ